MEYETIQLKSDESDSFLINGLSFRKRGDICFVVRHERTYWPNGEEIQVLCAEKDSAKVGDILQEAWKWANENNFLKGEAFSLGGEFLPKTTETWGDLFLEQKNEREVKRSVELLNKNGKQAAARGQVYMGPPGTGKTLSGRLIRNHCDATFIWVGGRECYYRGGINSILESFDLAKDLAPAVVFLEDIDSSLKSRSAVDVLKTEMDGIGRKSGVLTIVTTNHPETFPEALLDRPGRFHDVLKFDLPTESVRKQMIGKWLPELSVLTQASVAKDTDGYSGAHVYELCQYTKTIHEQGEVDFDSAVKTALSKIADQRELINETLMGGRTFRRSGEVIRHKVGEIERFKAKPKQQKSVHVIDELLELVS